jgi:L-ascorbate metabolism protein UlaG (beta-lactamase superfamily)
MKRQRHVSGMLALAAATTCLQACGLFSQPPVESYSSLHTWPPLQSGVLTARYFGSTTIQIDDGETAIMVDGFFSRPGFLRVIFGTIAPDLSVIVPDFSVVENALTKRGETTLAAVLVAHAHHDHVLDAPVVADRIGALLVGSKSTEKVASSYGLSDCICTVRHGDTLRLGNFTIDFFESPHSRPHFNAGAIDTSFRTPAGARAYKSGENYSFLIHHQKGTVLIWPSANFVPCLLRDVKADVVFLGIGGLGMRSKTFVRDYWREVVKATDARLVIPIHWDNFFRPLEQPLRPMPLMDNFDRSIKLIRELAQKDEVIVRLMPKFEPISLPPTELTWTSQSSLSSSHQCKPCERAAH